MSSHDFFTHLVPDKYSRFVDIAKLIYVIIFNQTS